MLLQNEVTKANHINIWNDFQYLSVEFPYLFELPIVDDEPLYCPSNCFFHCTYVIILFFAVLPLAAFTIHVNISVAI